MARLRFGGGAAAPGGADASDYYSIAGTSRPYDAQGNVHNLGALSMGVVGAGSWSNRNVDAQGFRYSASGSNSVANTLLGMRGGSYLPLNSEFPRFRIRTRIPETTFVNGSRYFAGFVASGTTDPSQSGTPATGGQYAGCMYDPAVNANWHVCIQGSTAYAGESFVGNVFIDTGVAAAGGLSKTIEVALLIDRTIAVTVYDALNVEVYRSIHTVGPMWPRATGGVAAKTLLPGITTYAGAVAAAHLAEFSHASILYARPEGVAEFPQR